MLGEFELIARYFEPLAAGQPGALGLTDDAAVVAPPVGRQLVFTVDTMVAGVHFLAEDPAGSVAQKLLRVNLSDLAAMGAAPLGYLLTCSWPKDTEESWVAAFAAGLAKDQETYSISVLGGDMTSTPGPLTFSLTAIGHVGPGQALRRSTARAGDLVYLSGTLGDGALGLMALTGKLPGLASEAADALAKRYRRPQPRLMLGRLLAEEALATACLDVSDGLVADLGHICEASGLGAEVDAVDLPLSEATQAVLAEEQSLLAAVLTGGDDYELCFTAPPVQAEQVAALAPRLGHRITRIGRMVEGEGVQVLDRDGTPLELDSRGWTHF